MKPVIFAKLLDASYLIQHILFASQQSASLDSFAEYLSHSVFRHLLHTSEFTPLGIVRLSLNKEILSAKRGKRIDFLKIAI